MSKDDDKIMRSNKILLTIFVIVITLSLILVSEIQPQVFAKKRSHASPSNPSSSSEEIGSFLSNSNSSNDNGSSRSESIDLNKSQSSIDPTNCDQPGYISCYRAGYSDGQANPGISCPSGHSSAYCDGYNAGSQSVNNSSDSSQSNNSPTENGGTNSGTQSSVDTTHNQPESTGKRVSEVNLNQLGKTNTDANVTNESDIGNKANLNFNLGHLSSHKSKVHNPSSSSSRQENSNVNISQTDQSNSNLAFSNSSDSHIKTKSDIGNRASVNSNLLNISPSYESESHGAKSVKQNSKTNINQIGQTNSSINLDNSSRSNVSNEFNINNNAKVNSKVNPNLNNPSRYSGTSPSPIIQNSKTTVNQGAQNNANINVNNSPGTRITNEQTIKQSVRINNEVNNIIKRNEVNNIINENTISAPRQPLTNIVTLKLANSTMSSGALFPLADIEPYRVIGGHITANLPNSSKQNIVAAQISDDGQIRHAVILDLKQITGSNLDQSSLYETSLGSDISGTNPFTGNPDEVNIITNLFLWNNNPQPMVLDDANGITINLIYR